VCVPAVELVHQMDEAEREGLERGGRRADQTAAALCVSEFLHLPAG